MKSPWAIPNDPRITGHCPTDDCPDCGYDELNCRCDDVDIVGDMGDVVAPAPCPNCSSADPFEADGFTVLGRCVHGIDLDREFCPQGCRV